MTRAEYVEGLNKAIAEGKAPEYRASTPAPDGKPSAPPAPALALVPPEETNPEQE